MKSVSRVTVRLLNKTQKIFRFRMKFYELKFTFFLLTFGLQKSIFYFFTDLDEVEQLQVHFSFSMVALESNHGLISLKLKGFLKRKKRNK